MLRATKSVKQEPTLQGHWKEVEECGKNNISLQVSDLYSQMRSIWFFKKKKSKSEHCGFLDELAPRTVDWQNV